MRNPKIIKIFLASSITELKDERIILADYINNRIAPILKNEEIFVRLFKCEDDPSGNFGESSQKVIDKELKNSNVSVFLFKNKAGAKTIEEFNLAQKLQKNQKHWIYVYCFNVPENERSQELIDFQQRLKEDEFYWHTCDNIDSLESHFVPGLLKYLFGENAVLYINRKSKTEKGGDARFKEYQNNEKIQALLKDQLHQDIESLLHHIKTLKADETKNIALRIDKIIKLYKKADHWASATGYDKKKYSELLFEYANSLFIYGLYNDAKDIFQRQIPLSEKQFGVAHIKTVISYNKIGRLYFELSNYRKSKNYLNKALAADASIDKKEDKNTAKIYDDLGSVYWKQGNYDKALDLLKRALIIRKNILGTNHSDTAESYNNIGLVFDDKTMYTNALKSFKKALRILDMLENTNKDDIATVYGNIGFVYTHMKNFKKAFEYCNKSLELKKNFLGNNHPDTATAYHNIGKVYLAQEKYTEAKKCFMKAKIIDENILGINHPDTATDYNSLGIVYYKNNNYKKALEFLNKALEIRITKLIPKHHCILETQELIAAVKKAMDKK